MIDSFVVSVCWQKRLFRLVATDFEKALPLFAFLVSENRLYVPHTNCKKRAWNKFCTFKLQAEIQSELILHCGTWRGRQLFIPFLSPNGQLCENCQSVTVKEYSTISVFSPFLYRCVFHFPFHQMTLPCDCGLMGKFSWPFFFPVTQEISETIFAENFSLHCFCGCTRIWQTCGKWRNCNATILRETRIFYRKQGQFTTVFNCWE